MLGHRLQRCQVKASGQVKSQVKSNAEPPQLNSMSRVYLKMFVLFTMFTAHSFSSEMSECKLLCQLVSKIIRSNTMIYECVMIGLCLDHQQAQNIYITFIQRRPNVFAVGQTLYKWHTNVLCLLSVNQELWNIFNYNYFSAVLVTHFLLVQFLLINHAWNGHVINASEVRNIDQ